MFNWTQFGKIYRIEKFKELRKVDKEYLNIRVYIKYMYAINISDL